MTARAASANIRWWLWAAAPVLTLAGAYISTYAIDAVMRVGPFDRAWLGWMITIPLIVVSPWLAAQAAHRAEGGSLRWVAVVGPAILVAAGLTVMLGVSAEYVGCEPVTSPLQVLPRSLAVGTTGGLTYAAAAGIALLVPRRRPIVALFLSVTAAVIGLLGVILTFAIVFPGLSCAMPN